MSDHGTRKADHLDLCSSDRVAFKKQTTLLEEVTLLHDALPEMAMDDVDLGTSIVGKRPCLHDEQLGLEWGGGSRAHSLPTCVALRGWKPYSVTSTRGSSE